MIESSEKGMYIIQSKDINTLIASMALGIHQINTRSWGTLVLRILKAGPLRTPGMILQLKLKFNRQQENNDIVNHLVYEIILKEGNKVNSKSEAHENI